MLETEPLIPPDPDECARTESYEAPWDLEMAQRLHDLGGHVDIIAVEEPYHDGHLLDTPEACRHPVERVVDEVVQHVGNLGDLFGFVHELPADIGDFTTGADGTALVPSAAIGDGETRVEIVSDGDLDR